MLLTAIGSDPATDPATLKALAERAAGDPHLTLALLTRSDLPAAALAALDADTPLRPGAVHAVLGDTFTSAAVRAQVLTNWSAAIGSMTRYADLSTAEILTLAANPDIRALQHVAEALARNPRTPADVAEQALVDHARTAVDNERLTPVVTATLAFERGVSQAFFDALDRRDGLLAAQRDAYLTHRAAGSDPDMGMLGRGQWKGVLGATTNAAYAAQVLDAAREQGGDILEDVCAAIARNARLTQDVRREALIAEPGSLMNLAPHDAPLPDDAALGIIEIARARTRAGLARAGRVANSVLSHAGRAPGTLQRIAELLPPDAEPLLPHHTLLAVHPNTPVELRAQLCAHHQAHPGNRALSPVAMPIAEALLIGPDAILDVSLATLRAARDSTLLGELLAHALGTAWRHAGWVPEPGIVATIAELDGVRTGTLRDLITSCRAIAT